MKCTIVHFQFNYIVSTLKCTIVHFKVETMYYSEGVANDVVVMITFEIFFHSFNQKLAGFIYYLFCQFVI